MKFLGGKCDVESMGFVVRAQGSMQAQCRARTSVIADSPLVLGVDDCRGLRACGSTHSTNVQAPVTCLFVGSTRPRHAPCPQLVQQATPAPPHMRRHTVHQRNAADYVSLSATSGKRECKTGQRGCNTKTWPAQFALGS